MANLAIGMIETKVYVPALSAADAMVKAANVEIVARNEVGGGLVLGGVGPPDRDVGAGAEQALDHPQAQTRVPTGDHDHSVAEVEKFLHRPLHL